MKYSVKTDTNGYVISLAQDPKGIEIDLSAIDLDFLFCYKLQDGKLIIDQGKKDEEIEKETKKTRIAELRSLLTESDDIMGGFLDDMASLNNPVTFISDFIKLIGNINTKYAQLITDRKAWREELESLLK